MRRTVWVTGAAGFTGRHLVRYLRQQGPDVRVIGVDRVTPPDLDVDPFVALDLCAAEATAEAVARHRPEIVFHLAGLMPPHDEAEMHAANVAGSVNLGTALAQGSDRMVRLVTAGSAAEYLPTDGPVGESSPVGGRGAYGRTKAEQSARLLGLSGPRLEVIVARPFNLLGPGLSTHLVAGALCEQFRTTGRSQGFIAPLGSIEAVRDFVDVRDVASAYWLLANRGAANQAYNVCTGVGTSIARIVSLLEDAFGIRVETRLPESSRRAPADSVIGDNGKLVALGWRPTRTVEQSLRDMAEAEGSAETGTGSRD